MSFLPASARTMRWRAGQGREERGPPAHDAQSHGRGSTGRSKLAEKLHGELAKATPPPNDVRARLPPLGGTPGSLAPIEPELMEALYTAPTSTVTSTCSARCA